MTGGQGRFGASNTVAARLLCRYKYVMSINAGKNSSRGRPRVDSEEVTSRMHRPVLVALDAAADAEPDEPSRSEMVRRIVTGWLQGRGLLTAESSPAPSDPEQEIRDRASRSARQRSDGKARSHAATAVEAEMHGTDATAEEKESRRKTLTDEPAVVTRAKAKHSKGM